MNFEESRLRTFRNWPTSSPVDARRIAKAGFYYMGQNLEVQCFSCGGRISEWNFNDKVMTKHRNLDPRCPFVLNPAVSGNIPIINCHEVQGSSLNREEDSSLNITEPDMVNDWPNGEIGNVNRSSPVVGLDQMYENSDRLKTFTNWPVTFIVTPKSLADAGFYYVQQGDKVRCAYCSVIIGQWEAGDNPMTEHRRHSPGCSFVSAQSCRSTSNSDNSNSSGITFRKQFEDFSDQTLKSLGVQFHKVAKHPKYSRTDIRLSTYTAWPGNIPQTPEDLAEAGFYYVGSDDQVRCFHCDGGLRRWDPSDDPWVEHARWFPTCGFVTLMKGEQFIDDAMVQRPPVVPEVEISGSPKMSIHRPTGHLARVHQVSEEELDVLMNSPITSAALQIGLDFSRVKTAIRQKLEQTGVPFSSSHDLIEATLDIQLDEVSSQDTEETWSTPLHSPVRHRSPNIRPGRRLRDRVTTPPPDSSESDTNETYQPSVTLPNRQTTEKPPESASAQNSASEADRKVTLEEEIRRLKEARLCKICMDNEVCIVFLPCGHLVTCVNCAHSIASCPLCRQTIKATVRTFLS